ncbi:MAG: hypothetical protein HKN34_05150 [Gammaproteobacteria bacterium]|nr:hypothetical protein [Gammaproteobacteria bacterium]
MIIESLLYFLVQSYLNPILLLLYIFSIRNMLQAAGIRVTYDDQSSGIRLKFHSYLIVAPILYALLLVMDFFFLINFNAQLSLLDRLNAGAGWLNYLSYIITFFYIKEMLSARGFSAGHFARLLIHIPVIAIAVLAQATSHLLWISTVILK